MGHLYVYVVGLQMRIQLAKFGQILISRPSGHEALLAMKAYFAPGTSDEVIELDFTGVGVVAPSWLDEVLSGLSSEYGRARIRIVPSTNISLIESLKALEWH